MVIAGSNQAPAYPDGWKRVRDIEFVPTEADTKIYFRAPQARGFSHSDTVDAVKEVKAEGAKFLLGREEVDFAIDAIYNWGCNSALPKTATVLNTSDAVVRSSNVTECLKALGDLAPMTWDDAHEIWGKDVVAKRNHGSHGRGKRAFRTAGHRGGKLLFKYDVFQQTIRHRTEWRVIVFEETIVGASRKVPPDDTRTWNFKPEWHFKRVQEIPYPVQWLSIEATKRIGLHVAGIDVIRDEDTGRYYVLETNSAPGMNPETLRRLYMHIQKKFRGPEDGQ